MRQVKKVCILGIALLLSSCFKKKEAVSWHTEVLTPIASAHLGVDNIITDSLFKLGTDSTLILTYQQNLQNLKVDSIVPFQGQEYVERILIREFPITTRDMSKYIAIRDFLQSVPQPFRAILESNDDNTIMVPSFTNLSSSPDTIKADEVFTSADIITGNLNTTVSNELNFAIKNINYTIKNRDDGTVLGGGVVDRIGPGETVTTVIPLDGKHVEGSLVYEITRMDVEGTSSPVLVDLDKGLLINVVAKDLKAKVLTAVFPKQDFVQRDFDTELEGVEDKLLTRVKIKSGKIQLKYISTSPDTVKFNYKILDAKLGVDTFKFVGKFNPSPDGNAISGIIEKDISGFDLDLLLETSTGNMPNRFRSTLSAGFDSTGRMVTINEDDSIRMEIKLVDVVPALAQGYLGKDTFAVGPTVSNFEVFKDLKNIDLSFDNIVFKLHIANGAGLPAKVDLKKIEGHNTVTGTSVMLNLNNPSIAIPAATDNPFTVARTTYSLTKDNSNIVNFLNNKPDRLTYQANAITNPQADPNNVSSLDLNQFLTDQSSMSLDLDIALPLEVSVTNLTLEDTTLISTFDLSAIEKVKDGTISLLLENQIPIGMDIKLLVIDKEGHLVDSIASSTPIQAAEVDPITGKCKTPTHQKIDYYFDTDKLKRLLSSEKIHFKVLLNTPSGKHFKLYAYNKLKVNLVGRFNYLVSSK